MIDRCGVADVAPVALSATDFVARSSAAERYSAAMRMCLVATLVACSSPATSLKSSPPAAPVAPVDPGLEPPLPTLRLPRNFTPSGYSATLAIDPSRTGFDSKTAITGEIVQRSSVIWLHGHKLVVTHASATRAGRDVAIAVTPHGDELLELRAAAPLDAGTWTLALDYTGSYEMVDTAGAFKQVVRDASYVYTQFEAL